MLLSYFILIILQSCLVLGGKMYTPINNWYKVACLPEQIKANGHYICDQHGTVICLPGWSNEKLACSVPFCDFNGETCVHGNCTEPERCTCDIGWQGLLCNECVCLPGCVNGYCEDPMECICETGWQGMFCDKPECGPCTHGHCSAPGICTCHPGYTGPTCEDCIPNPDCEYGTCINNPFECVCYDGFEGLFCTTPICKESCHPEHGMCLQPDECWCKPGWSGDTCSECLTSWGCVNGYCEEPFQCICEDGFLGKDCNSTVPTDGNWGQWEPWSSCSDECYQRRNRSCDDPPPSGGGWYCSNDGSNSTETRKCLDNINCNEATWTEWSVFSGCSVTCGPGMQTRTRECSTGVTSDCPPQTGGTTDAQSCNPGVCPITTQWSVWGECSVTCGGGIQSRTRDCSSGNQGECPPGTIYSEQRDCNDDPCPIDGGVSEWTVYGPCDKLCLGDVGERVRRRFCTNPAPEFGGLTCLEQGIGLRDSLPCQGTIPFQSTDPNSDCFNIVQ